MNLYEHLVVSGDRSIYLFQPEDIRRSIVCVDHCLHLGIIPCSALQHVERDYPRDAESSGSFDAAWTTGLRQFHANQTMTTVVVISITLKKT